MFATLAHLNQEKVRYNFNFIINELTSFTEGFKLKKIPDDEIIFVKKIIIIIIFIIIKFIIKFIIKYR
jgi:hypothetical protein